MWMYYALAAAMTWGLEYALLDRILGSKVSPYLLRAVQMSAGALGFAIICAFSGKLAEDVGRVLSERSVLAMVGVSLVTFSLANILIAMSIRDGSALLAGLVEMTHPIFIVLFSIALFGTTAVTPQTALGGVMIVAGIGVLKFAS